MGKLHGPPDTCDAAGGDGQEVSDKVRGRVMACGLQQSIELGNPTWGTTSETDRRISHLHRLMFAFGARPDRVEALLVQVADGRPARVDVQAPAQEDITVGRDHRRQTVTSARQAGVTRNHIIGHPLGDHTKARVLQCLQFPLGKADAIQQIGVIHYRSKLDVVDAHAF